MTIITRLVPSVPAARPSFRRKAQTLLGSTALMPIVGAMAAASLLAMPGAAFAQDIGDGGDGGGGGGTGGTSNVGVAGDAGGAGVDPGAGGGGGGSGTTGGAGGTGEGGAAGGTGGSSNTFIANPGLPGQAAVTANGGGGGGGGAGSPFRVFVGTTTQNVAFLVQGAGGAGGAGSGSGSGGGGGAGGGLTRIYTGTSLFQNNGSTTAGDGGAGGAGGITGNGGNGGAGGFGLNLSFVPGSGSSLASPSGSAIRGGNGGAGGAGVVVGNGGAGGTGLIVSGGAVNAAGPITGGNGGTGSVVGAGGVGLIGSDITLNNTGTISGGLSGDGLTRALSLALSGTNTIIGLGTLTGGVELTSGTTTFNLATNQTLSEVISGAGGLTKIGVGQLTLSGVNTYTGVTTINEGVIRVEVGGSLAGDVVNNQTFVNAGTVNGLVTNNALMLSSETLNGGLVNNVGATALLARVVNGGIINFGTITVIGDLVASGAFVQDATGIFDLDLYNASVGSLSGDGAVQIGGGTLRLAIDNSSTSFAGAFGGTGTVSKLGTGVFTLTGNSGFTGIYSVDEGTLSIASSGVLAGLVVNNATLFNAGTLNGGVDNFGNFASIGTINGGLDQFASANAFVSGTLNGAINNAGTLIVNGDLFSNGLLTITDLGSVQVLAGTRWTGLSGIDNAGTAFPGMAIAGILDTGGVVTNRLGARLQIADTGTLAALNTQNFGTIINSGSVLSSVTNSGTIINNSAWIGTFVLNAGTITNNLTWRNSTLVAAQVNGGTFDNFGLLLSDGVAVNGAGAVLNNRSGASISLTGAAQLTNANGGQILNAGTILGDIENNAVLVSTGTITGTLNNLLNGTVSLAGAMNGSINSAGTITLTGATTGIDAFTQDPTGIFDLAGVSVSIGSLAGSGEVRLGTGVLTVGSNNASTTFGGEISGNGGLIKTGTGTFTLSGTNSFTGLTSVLGGTLINTGSLAGSVGVTGGAFENSGLVSGDLTVGNGALATNNLGGSILGTTSVMTGGQMNNLGTLASVNVAGTLTNSGVISSQTSITGTLTNSGQIFGSVINEGSLTSTGTITGALANLAGGIVVLSGGMNGVVFNAGSLTSTGTITGSLDNLPGGVVLLSGAMNGSVNNAGTITLTGTTTGIGAFTQNPNGIFDLAGFSTSIGSLAGSGEVRLGSAVLTVGSNNTSTIFGGVISGSGGLVKTGFGQLTLSGVNTYTGVTTINEGVIRVEAGGSLAGAVVNNQTLVNAGIINGLVTNNSLMLSADTLNGGLVNNAGATALLARTINGAVTNAGTIRAIGNFIASGAFTQDASGILDLDSYSASLGSLAGAGTVTLGSGRLFTNTNDASTTFSGVISGSGGLTKVGTGTLTLSGLNTYTGATMVSAGTLAVTSTGRIAGSVSNSATLTNAGTIGGMLVNNAGASATNTGTISGAVRNDGSLVSTGTLGAGLVNNGIAQIRGSLTGDVLNTGRITLTGATTGIGVFEQTAPGVLELAGFNTTIGVVTGAGSITLGGATLTTGRDGIASTFSGVISGNGNLTKVGTGLLTLTGANTYVGTTTISGGILQVGNNGTTGSIIGPVVNNGRLVFSRSDAVTFAGLISGTGIFVQDGTGTTTLTGANTYTGGTLISRGRLVGNTTSLQGLIQNDAALEFAQATSGTFAGQITGAGRFDKTGLGLLTLTGNSGTFSGGTFVQAGELRVNGSLARSVVTVQSGGILSGTGTIGGLVATSGSIVAPGTSPGTLTVNGNVTLQAGSTVQFEIGATGPTDRINATGTAALGGTAAFTNLGGTYAFNSQFVLVQADGGRTGTFAGTTGFGGFGILYRPELVYNGTQAILRLAANRLTNIVGSTALTANQRSLAEGIDAAVIAGYNPQPLFNIYSLPTAQLPGAFDQLSGEVYASAAGVGIEQERLLREAVFGRLASVAQAGRDAPETASGLGVWGQFFGGWGDGDSDGNAASFDTDRTGFATGLDYGNANENGSWRIGLFGTRVQSDVTIAARGSVAEVEQSGGGAYASFNTGGFGVVVGGYLTDVDLRAFRTISLPGFGETNVGVTEGTARQAFAEVSYAIDAGGMTFRPFVAGSIGTFKLDALTETGGAAALTMREQQYDTGTVIGGVDAAVPVAKWLRLNGTLAARAQLGDTDPQATLALAAAPQQGFAISGVQLDELALAARLEAQFLIADRLSVSLGYTGLLGEAQTDHGARATVHVAF